MEALSLYRDQSAGVRLHTRLRAWSAPLESVIAALPRDGFVLDVGCGHGLISNEFALRSASGRVLGIDLSDTKIAAARATIGTRRNLEFRRARLEDIAETDFDAVCLIDVLYLVPAPSRAAFLEKCRQKLKPGGTLVLKEIGNAPAWKFERLKVQEFISTRVLRITTGETMHFESGEELAARLERTGFADVALKRLDAGYSSPHILLTARRPR